MLSFEDRLLQLERLERWCSKATTWQQYRVALQIGLFLGSVAGLIGAAAPYPTPDDVCEIISHQMKIADLTAYAQTESDHGTRSQVFYRAPSAGRIGLGPEADQP